MDAVSTIGWIVLVVAVVGVLLAADGGDEVRSGSARARGPGPLALQLQPNGLFDPAWG